MMVKHSKPAPDIFLLAAERLGVDPSECIIIEDSFHGVTAAAAAGITSIGLINPNSGEQDLGKAAILVEGFEEIDFSFINRVYQKAHHEPVTILTTDHFVIRELSVKDADTLFELYKKPEIAEFLDNFSDDYHTEKEKLIAYIDQIYPYYGFGLWGVFLKSSDQLIGCCGIDLKKFNKEELYELSYLLDPNYHGRGYAKEFTEAVINYCFQQLEVPEIVAVIDQNNIQSIRLAERLGMHCNGEFVRNARKCYRYEIINIQ